MHVRTFRPHPPPHSSSSFRFPSVRAYYSRRIQHVHHHNDILACSFILCLCVYLYRILAEEALATCCVERCTVWTATGCEYSGMRPNSSVVAVSIVRAGDSLLDAVLHCSPNLPVGTQRNININVSNDMFFMVASLSGEEWEPAKRMLS
jgi:hypothetical protein